MTYRHHQCCPHEIIEQFQKCHQDHPIGKFFAECTDKKQKITLERCFCQEKVVKGKESLEQSKKLRERLQAYRKEAAEAGQQG